MSMHSLSAKVPSCRRNLGVTQGRTGSGQRISGHLGIRDSEQRDSIPLERQAAPVIAHPAAAGQPSSVSAPHSFPAAPAALLPSFAAFQLCEPSRLPRVT